MRLQRATRKPWPEARRARTRTKLVEAAYRLMSKKGVEATSVQEITDLADVGGGTFYNYFTTKEEIAGQALDCLIHTLARRMGSALEQSGVTEPVETITFSVRGDLNEILTNRIWYWWIQRPDLLVERTRAGFRELGESHIRRALDAGRVTVPGKAVATAWSMVIWQMVAGAKDIVDGRAPADSAGLTAIAILQALGVSAAEAARLCAGAAPRFPEMALDFSFVAAESAAEADD